MLKLVGSFPYVHLFLNAGNQELLALAKARNADVLLCDTAGRLHNKKNLMEELKKIHRILEKEYPEALFYSLLQIFQGSAWLIPPWHFH